MTEIGVGSTFLASFISVVDTGILDPTVLSLGLSVDIDVNPP